MDSKMLEIWNTPFFGEKFAKFYKLLLKAEDQDEIDQLKLTTEYEKKMAELFRNKRKAWIFMSQDLWLILSNLSAKVWYYDFMSKDNES